MAVALALKLVRHAVHLPVFGQEALGAKVKKEAKLNGRSSSTKLLINQYKKLIENHSGTPAAQRAALRITALESQ